MPTVTAITSIAMDHAKLLGPTIETIACHKEGIFKLGSVAFSTLQEPAVMEVLQQRAADKGVLPMISRTGPYNPDQCDCLNPENQLLPGACSLFLAGKVSAYQSIIRNGRIAGVVDLALAGWYLEYWDLTKAYYISFKVPDWPESIKLKLPSYADELVAERLL
ncbi:uncharacterized protein PADG_11121 [Paracoccidioides brasiliensis Pb18]|uniref:Uncharacterized protein n=1 Tax=Paracoccidioides brasiliensis (strain Pb18) TaxID=502780 RepID=A0A0A0HVS4_PARBD|nr:uncharacterized protein PADG_11121 [Paracoccidioides brasiliensis Pb18]KGM92667.1 hypothetical protein PADG_11121 [Paracoccidioides brasiliensis Pb18]